MSVASTSEQVQALEQLIALINPDPAIAKAQIVEFKSLLNHSDECSSFQLMHYFSQATQPTASFYVDWKDVDTLISCINNMAQNRQIEINWVVDAKLNHNHPDSPDVHVLLEHVFDQFFSHNLRLWGWNTSGEDYGGWLAPVAFDAEIQSIAQVLGIDFYTECVGYSLEELAQIESTPRFSRSNNSNLSLIQQTFRDFKHSFASRSIYEQLKSSWQIVKFLLLFLLLVPLIFLFKGMLKCINFIQLILSKSD
jgi:hypothetical protein